jgi:hypothetical protein
VGAVTELGVGIALEGEVTELGGAGVTVVVGKGVLSPFIPRCLRNGLLLGLLTSAPTGVGDGTEGATVAGGLGALIVGGRGGAGGGGGGGGGGGVGVDEEGADTNCSSLTDSFVGVIPPPTSSGPSPSEDESSNSN